MHVYRYDRNGTFANTQRVADYFQKSFRRVLTDNAAGTMQTWITEYGAIGVKGEPSAAEQKQWVSTISNKFVRFRDQWKVGPLMHHVWQDNLAFRYPDDYSEPELRGQVKPAARTGLWREPGVGGATSDNPAGTTYNRKPAGAAAAKKGTRCSGGIALPPRRGATAQSATC